MVKAPAIEKRFKIILELLNEISSVANYFEIKLIKEGHMDDKKKTKTYLKMISYSFISFSNRLEEFKDFFPEFSHNIEEIQNNCRTLPNLTLSVMSIGIERLRSKLAFIRNDSNRLHDKMNIYAEETY